MEFNSAFKGLSWWTNEMLLHGGSLQQCVYLTFFKICSVLLLNCPRCDVSSATIVSSWTLTVSLFKR